MVSGVELRNRDHQTAHPDERIVLADDLRIAVECMRWLANTDIHVPGMDEAGPRLEAAIGGQS